METSGWCIRNVGLALDPLVIRSYTCGVEGYLGQHGQRCHVSALGPAFNEAAQCSGVVEEPYDICSAEGLPGDWVHCQDRGHDKLGDCYLLLALFPGVNYLAGDMEGSPDCVVAALDDESAVHCESSIGVGPWSIATLFLTQLLIRSCRPSALVRSSTFW